MLCDTLQQIEKRTTRSSAPSTQKAAPWKSGSLAEKKIEFSHHNVIAFLVDKSIRQRARFKLTLNHSQIFFAECIANMNQHCSHLYLLARCFQLIALNQIRIFSSLMACLGLTAKLSARQSPRQMINYRCEQKLFSNDFASGHCWRKF